MMLWGVMTKANIAEMIRDHLGFKRNESIVLVDLFLDIMKDPLRLVGILRYLVLVHLKLERRPLGKVEIVILERN